MKRPKVAPRKPRFKPLWIEQEGVRMASDHCAAEAVEQPGTRLVALARARTAAEL